MTNIIFNEPAAGELVILRPKIGDEGRTGPEFVSVSRALPSVLALSIPLLLKRSIVFRPVTTAIQL